MSSASIRRTTLACLTGLAMALACTAASAQKAPPRSSDTSTPKTQVGAPEATATAPNARLAALVKFGGQIILEKNVDSVVRRATGIYCIKPSAASGIIPGQSVVMVTVDYYYSQLNEAMAQWASRGHGCGNDRIGVYTLADKYFTGEYSFTNLVGFSILVP